MSADLSIEHVSDTAIWVAHFRAREAQRPDAIFQDPLASLLAGIAFFKQTGWYPRKIITSGEESETIHGPYPLDFPRGLIMRALPREVRLRILDLSGVVLMYADETPTRLSTRASSPRPAL